MKSDLITEQQARNLVFKTRDGEVKWGEPIWWWSEDKPEHVVTDYQWKQTWRNLLVYPEYHSIQQPNSFKNPDTQLFEYPDLW